MKKRLLNFVGGVVGGMIGIVLIFVTLHAVSVSGMSTTALWTWVGMSAVSGHQVPVPYGLCLNNNGTSLAVCQTPNWNVASTTITSLTVPYPTSSGYSGIQIGPSAIYPTTTTGLLISVPSGKTYFPFQVNASNGTDYTFIDNNGILKTSGNAYGIIGGVTLAGNNIIAPGTLTWNGNTLTGHVDPVAPSSTVNTTATATCLSGEQVVGGGGNCGLAALTTSRPSGTNGWQVICSASTNVYVYAICLKN